VTIATVPFDVPEIVAGAYQLRPLEMADAPELLLLLAEPSLSESMSGEAPTTLADVRAWLERRLERPHTRTGLSWTVRTAVGGALAGTVECHHVIEEESVAEIGYGTATAHRGQGVASTAVHAVTAYAHRALGIHRVEILHERQNLASCKVAAACGYHVEGTLRGAMRVDESFVDLHLHSHLATDLEGGPLAV